MVSTKLVAFEDESCCSGKSLAGSLLYKGIWRILTQSRTHLVASPGIPWIELPYSGRVLLIG